MILIALGANLPSDYGQPADTLQAALNKLEASGVKIVKSSRIWLTAPVPFDPKQDWFHNSVVEVKTSLSPHELFDLLLSIEHEFGRVRTVKNAPRLLDMDIIAYNDEVITEGERLIIPHERMQERLFVLKPLEDLSKNWTHPLTGQSITEMLQKIPAGQEAKPMEDGQ